MRVDTDGIRARRAPCVRSPRLLARPVSFHPPNPLTHRLTARCWDSGNEGNSKSPEDLEPPWKNTRHQSEKDRARKRTEPGNQPGDPCGFCGRRGPRELSIALGNYERVRKPVRQTLKRETRVLIPQLSVPPERRSSRTLCDSNRTPHRKTVNSNRIRNIGCGASLRQGETPTFHPSPWPVPAHGVLKKSGRHQGFPRARSEDEEETRSAALRAENAHWSKMTFSPRKATALPRNPSGRPPLGLARGPEDSSPPDHEASPRPSSVWSPACRAPPETSVAGTSPAIYFSGFALLLLSTRDRAANGERISAGGTR